MGVMQAESAFASRERHDPVSAIMADVGWAAERDARAGAPLLDNGRLVAAEIGVVREDIGDAAEAQPADLSDRWAGGNVEHRAVDAIEMLAHVLDEQIDAGEVGLERGPEQV